MEREDVVARHRRTADLFLLLISADFLASPEYQDTMQYVLQREKEGTAVVLPVLLRAVDWQRASFSHLQILPRNHLAVTSWVNTDEAFEEIVREMRAIVGVLRRWIVLASSPHHQSMLTRLANDLEGHRIPVSTHTDQAGLSDAIRRSSATILLTSPETCFSQVDREAMALAIIYQKLVIVLWLPDKELNEPVPSQWRGSICIDANTERYNLALQEILVQLKCRLSAPLVNSEEQKDHQPRNPYKGLHPFGMSDVSDFFGREKLVEQCLRVLQQALLVDAQGLPPSRLLAVIGPSGSGKSSVVMAGVLPRLLKGAIQGSETWIYLDSLVPGTDPAEALTTVLFKHFPETGMTTIGTDLQDGSMRGLHRYATALAGQQESRGTQVMLVVDQFEELFTQTISEEKRRLFLDLLITAITVPHGPLILIVTLRADFSDRVMLYSDLYRLIDTHRCSVLPIEIPNLRRVIEQPARLPDVQVRFEENLISDLLLEMRGQVGALPLLQFTLDQLFEKRDGHLLTSKAYQEMGGIKGALRQHAEATFVELLTEEHRKLAQTVFLRLIVPGLTQQETTRRRARRSELEVGTSRQTRLLQETTDTFVARRLLTTGEVAGVPTIEVSHETLLWEWPRLADWMSEAREDLRLQHVLSEDVVDWEQHNKPADRLYRGTQLKEARAWARRSMPSMNEMAFLRASKMRQIRSVISVITLFLLLVSSISTAGWYAWWFVQHQPPDMTRVTTLADDGPGSLRWCVTNASSGSTITFAQNVRGTIKLIGGDLAFPGDKKLTIDGPSENLLAISGNTKSAIHVSPWASVIISGLSLKDTKLDKSFFIHNEGTLRLTSVIISGNSALNSTIYNDHEGTLIVSNVTISGNSSIADTFSSGGSGGIFNDSEGMLIVSDSIISGNSSAYNGGGIKNSGTLTVSKSTISGNSAEQNGGGIYNSSALTVSNSTISGNSAERNGGGIHNSGGLTVSNSTISGNSAEGSTDSSYEGTGKGGGIFDDAFSSLFEDVPTVVNSTITGNSAARSGGGIYSSSALIDLAFCTIYNNRASDGGGIFTERYDGSDEYARKSRMTMRNSIVVANGPEIDIAGLFISGGYNLIQKKAGTTFTVATGDQFSPDLPGLFAKDVQLSGSGGETQTLALLADLRNPALNKIPLAFCQIKKILDEHSQTYIDQRGQARPGNKKAACDIGAYEAQM
jgi:hypothetical protein